MFYSVLAARTWHVGPIHDSSDAAEENGENREKVHLFAFVGVVWRVAS